MPETTSKSAYSITKAKYAKKFIFKVLEARTLTKNEVEGKKNVHTGVNGQAITKNKIAPFLTPQELEFSIYLVTNYLSNDISFSKYRYYDNLISLAFSFAKATNYRGHNDDRSKPTPNEQVVQKALKKLNSIHLIHYEFAIKKVSKATKEKNEADGKKSRKGIRIKFLNFNSKKKIPELFKEQGTKK